MDIEKYINYTSKCIDCNKCKNACSFLEKYNMTLKDVDKLSKLAYHCFLCGKCTEVCPVGIDGKEMIQEMRNEKLVGNEIVLNDKKYKTLIFEKNNYKFKNYRKSEKSVLFPGCNYTSLYPKTTKAIYEKLNEFEDIGIVYDCCGKPIAELGMKNDEENIIMNLEYRIKNLGIEEIITMCPNCYYYLKNKLSIPVKSIYEKCLQIGIELNYDFPIEKIYIPCPDRKDRIFINQIMEMIGPVEIINNIQCCGLGGLGGIKEPEISKEYGNSLSGYRDKIVYTYCASCTGKFNRDGDGLVYHVLSSLFQTYEVADTKKSFVNRMIKLIK